MTTRPAPPVRLPAKAGGSARGNALGKLIDILPNARSVGPEGCEAMAREANANGDLPTALLWHAAACLVAYDRGVEVGPNGYVKGEETP